MSKLLLYPFSLLLLFGVTLRAELPKGSAFDNSIGMKFARLEPGEFMMGNGEGPPKSRKEWEARDWDESPTHKVKLSQAFFMGVHEVTNAQYEQFDPAHKKMRGIQGASKEDNEPVTHVTWPQAVEFCAWLSKKENRAYRLPTEAEWEYGCKAGTTTAFASGDKLTPEQANLGVTRDGKKSATSPVGSYKANAWGLFDMHGNAAEWCHDWYGPYEANEQTDPVGRADGSARVARGWSWLIPARQADAQRFARSANRSGHIPEDANRYTGFRVVLGEMPKSKPLPEVIPPHQKEVKQTPAPKDGPDAKKPYFVNYAESGKQATIPAETWGPIFSHHNHYGAVCVCPNGDVLATWYSTVAEPGRELVMAATRLRVGSDTWEPASLFLDIPDVNDHAPVLHCDGKRIYHFFVQGLTGWDDSAVVMRTSDDSGATWSKPSIILSRDDPEHLSQPCSAFTAKDGTLVLACDGDNHKRERILTSKDGGKTWKVGKGDLVVAAGDKYVIHPAAVQLSDGSIITYMRGPHPMPSFLTRDLGEIWEMKTTPFPGISGGMKTSALKLQSGALLVCSIDSKKELFGGGTFAALSLDDGKTWSHHLKVPGVGGYMALAQAPNGVIYLFGSRMGCVAFNETWLKEGKPMK